MNFNEMKLAIYESYSNGEMSKEAATRLINSFENASIDHELDLALEAVNNAESSFMESAMQYSTGEVAQEVFEAEAKSFGEAVKKAWTAFKKWVKDIIDKIGKKISAIKAKFTGKDDKKLKITLPFNLTKMKKFVDDAVSHIKPPFDFADAWWDKVSNGDVKTILSSVGIAGAFTITIAERDKMLDALKDSLLKLNTKLNEIEAKGGDSKGIHVLRSIVSMANTVIISAASIIHKGSDVSKSITMDDTKEVHYDNAKYQAVSDMIDKRIEAVDTLKTQLDAADSKIGDAYSNLNNLTPDPNNSIYASAMTAYKAACADYDKLADQFANEKKAISSLNKGLIKLDDQMRKKCAKYISTVLTNSSGAIRSYISDANGLYRLAVKAKKHNNAKAVDEYSDLFKNSTRVITAYIDITKVALTDGADLGILDDKTISSYNSKMKTYDANVESLIDLFKSKL